MEGLSSTGLPRLVYSLSGSFQCIIAQPLFLQEQFRHFTGFSKSCMCSIIASTVCSLFPHMLHFKKLSVLSVVVVFSNMNYQAFSRRMYL